MTEQTGLPRPALPVGALPLRLHGELVVVSPAAAPSLRPGAEGWVVEIDAAPQEVHYTIEFDDGAMVHLPAHLVLNHPG
ncbi:hypothetical protein MW290_13680 [Aquincola tertiaricarbonis]|uniref:DUF4926 domain-containing protein n=1 Tax=Aquincola tertiaricarbonis TaxID=391953 RepID=A0ABY4S1F1_AQUTE|nr:hypothetical protein [Aquincola tertiaricarbonis]URI06937.1 hypothetical protein MW290_13680 [Aquincola tertiaricarbonis]